MILELVNEWGEVHSREVADRPTIERVNPLLTGDDAPVVTFVNAGDGWTTGYPPEHDGPFMAQTLLQRTNQAPLVVGFYCPCWGRYALPFLETLVQLADRVKQTGGQFVVFTNEPPKYLPRQAQQSSLTFVYDPDKTVARRFGIYAETDPIWDRVSGISEDVYIPTLYVVDETQQIRYHFLDEHFEGFADHDTLINSLFQ